MHSPSARALHHLERYCIILVHTLNHLMPGKCVINITYSGRNVKNYLNWIHCIQFLLNLSSPPRF